MYRNAKHGPPWKVLFFGTDHFSLPILKALHVELLKKYLPFRTDSVVSRLEVVTKSSPNDVSRFVAENSTDLVHHVWPDLDITPGKFDVGVIASFGKLIPKKLIDMFPRGILNVHPSLLPRWRGCAPIPYTILAGDQVTGVTIQQIRPHRFDVGPIVSQTEVRLPPAVTSLELCDLLSMEGANLIVETLRDLQHLEDVEVDQDDESATYAPKIHSTDVRLWIDWNNETCKQIDRKFRALQDLHDIKSYFGDLKVRLRNPVPMQDLWWYTLRDKYMASRPGSAVYIKSKGCVVIQCKDGLVGIRDVVVKKPLTAISFHNGYLSKPELKYTRFSNTKLVEEKALQIPNRQDCVAMEKHWHLQLMRLSSGLPDG